ncbi:MAG: hypothetical protein WDN45_18635 [Caulobacteraceae bacterium]
MTINLANGRLQDNSATTLGVSTLTMGGSSTLIVALDPANNRSTLFNVSGAATIASGAQIGATLLSTPSLNGQTFTILKAGSLSVGSIDSSLLVSLPYLFSGSLATSATAGTITFSVRTKSPADLGFNKSETAAFSAVYAALPQDTGIQTAIISAPDRASLVSAYDQLLPNSSGRRVQHRARHVPGGVARHRRPVRHVDRPRRRGRRGFHRLGFLGQRVLFRRGTEQSRQQRLSLRRPGRDRRLRLRRHRGHHLGRQFEHQPPRPGGRQPELGVGGGSRPLRRAPASAPSASMAAWASAT